MFRVVIFWFRVDIFQFGPVIFRFKAVIFRFRLVIFQFRPVQGGYITKSYFFSELKPVQNFRILRRPPLGEK